MQSPTKETKQEIAIGILGQDGHGKSTLVAAMLALLKHESVMVEDGFEITISIGSCREVPYRPLVYETDSRRYSIHDFSIHSDIVKNLILNRIPLDGVILIVSAVDGVTEQTKQQMRLARAAGVAVVAVFLNKCDLSDDPELLDLVEYEIRELVAQCGHASDTPIIRGSASLVLQKPALSDSEDWRGKAQELLFALHVLDPIQIDINELPFLMQVEEMFTITGRGTVVMGYVETGRCAINVPVELVGFGPTLFVIATDLESFGSYRNVVAAGNTASLLLRNVKRTDVLRGQVVSAPGNIQAYTRFCAELYLCKELERGLECHALKRKTNLFRIRTAEVNGTVNLGEPDKLVCGGDTIQITAELEAPIALERGVRFGITDGTTSMAFGIVTELIG